MRWLFLSFLFLFPFWGVIQPQDTPSLESPLKGEALQGVVSITGSTSLTGFESAEVAFTYDRDGANSWFLIRKSDEPVTGGELASWDTTTITDGAYRLRVQVIRADGSIAETQVRGLRVRNYTPIETSTPEAVQVSAPTSPAPAPSSGEQKPEPTRLPANPVGVTQGSLVFSLVRGGGFVALGFILVGVYVLIRSFFTHRRNDGS